MRAEDHVRQGLAAHQAGRLLDAERHYQFALVSDPGNFAAARMLGALYIQRQQFDLAEKFLIKASRINPRDAAVQQNLAVALLTLRRTEEAIAACNRAISLEAGNVAALHIKAMALVALGRHEEALTEFDRAIAQNPQFAQGFYDRGNTLAALSRWEEALASFEKAVAIHAAFPAAFSNHGTVLLMLGRPLPAVASFDCALSLKPDDADTWKKRGIALATLQRRQEAVDSYQRSIALNPRDASTFVDMAYVLQQLGREPEALAAFDKAAAINPDASSLAGGRMMMKMHLCDWENFEAEAGDLLARAGAGKPVGPPFTLFCVPATAAQQLAAASRYVADYYPAAAPLSAGKRNSQDRIRIGYMSTDFRAHATAVLMMDVFAAHDRRRFDITAISLGPDDKSPFRARLEGAFDRFIEAREMTDAEIARTINDLQIDILVDLNGHTQGARTGILARRPAPLQVNFVGYPGTMGAPYIDYLIADRVLVPEADERFYSEKIAALPGSYQPNTRREMAAQPTRGDCGLPETGFVFCAFNNTFKLTPDFFAVGMRLLKAVEGSALWLQEPHAVAKDNLRQAARAHGIAAERLVFAPRVRIEEHLARHALADLFIDTQYCTAHTTASDAIWCGLPIVTCRGQTFAGRVAASVLSAIGMDELITETIADYENLSLALAKNPVRLAEIKGKLIERRDASDLFDTARYARKLEQAYQSMWQRHQDGMPPASFTVER